jgi:transmembrane sensor
MNVLTELAVPLGKPSSRARRRASADSRQAVSRYRRLGLSAATIAICVTVAVTIWLQSNTFVGSEGLYRTDVGQQQTMTLADGSVALLNTNSQIKVDYGEKFRNVRLLQGEALFTVAGNSDRPFRVFVGNERIEAVGTSFSVYLKGDAVSVAVTEGSVAVASLDRARAVSRKSIPLPDIEGASDITSGEAYVQALGTLSAGQIAIINTIVDGENQHVSKLDDVQTIPSQEMAKRHSWRDGVLMFDGEPLDEVVEEISRYTTLTIEVSDPAISNIRIGGRFPIGAMEAMFATLEANFGVNVTRLGHGRVALSAAAGKPSLN